MTQNVQLKYINTETQNLEFLTLRENCQKVTLVLKWNLKLPREKRASPANEDIIQKSGTKFPEGEDSVELRSPERGIKGSSLVDERKMKLEDLQGKTKMPKLQDTKFGISLRKGKGPEPEISSPKPEVEQPQLKMTAEIADISVWVPASELKFDMSDPGEEAAVDSLRRRVSN